MVVGYQQNIGENGFAHIDVMKKLIEKSKK